MSIPDIPDLRAAFQQGCDDIYMAAVLMLPFPASASDVDVPTYVASLSIEDRVNYLIDSHITATEPVAFEEIEKYNVSFEALLNKPEYQQLTTEQRQRISAQAAGRLATADKFSETILRLRYNVPSPPELYTKCTELKAVFESIAVDCVKIYKDENGVDTLLTPESLVSLAMTPRP